MEKELLDLLKSANLSECYSRKIPLIQLDASFKSFIVERTAWKDALKCHELKAMPRINYDELKDDAEPWQTDYYGRDEPSEVICSITDGHVFFISWQDDERILTETSIEDVSVKVDFSLPTHQLYNILTHFTEERIVIEIRPFADLRLFQESYPEEVIEMPAFNRVGDGWTAMMGQNIEFNLQLSRSDICYLVKNYAPFSEDDCMHETDNYIWITSKDGVGSITSYSWNKVRYDSFESENNICYALSVPCLELALKATEDDCEDDEKFQIGTSDGHFVIAKGKLIIEREIPIPSQRDIVKVIERSIPEKTFTIRKSSVAAFLAKVRVFDAGFRETIVIHKFSTYVCFHWKDWEHTLFEYAYILPDSQDEKVWKVSPKLLDIFLNLYDGPELVLSYSDKHNCIQIHPQKPVSYLEHTRIISTSVISEKESYSNDTIDIANRKEKYQDEGPVVPEPAFHEEQKEEAIKRMRDLGMTEDIINALEKDNEIMVYEPPYGAAYYLEEDELAYVKSFERQRDVFVWGIIRSYMTYNRQKVTVDCLLSVSSDKSIWEDEEWSLKNGCPYVHTTMKEFELEDHGTINISMSQGGTPIRVFYPIIK